MTARGTTGVEAASWRSRPDARLVVALTAALALSIATPGSATGAEAEQTETATPAAGTPTGDDVAALDQQVRRAQRRAERVEAELESLAADLVVARDELVRLDGRLADAEARLRALNGQVQLAERELEARERAARRAAAAAAAAAEAQEEAERELAAEEQRLDDQMAMTFMHGTTARPVMMLQMLEDTEDPGNLAADVYRLGVVLETQVSLVDHIDQLRAERVAATELARERRSEADAAQAEAAEAVTFVEGLREDQRLVREAVEADRDRQETVLASLRADASEQEAVLASVAAEVDQLEAERAQAVAARQRAAAEAAARQREAEASGTDDGGGSGASGAGGGGGGDSGDTGGGISSGVTGSATITGGPCAVDGAVSGRDFSNDWGYPRSGGRRHEGTDVFANRGTPVRAMADGTVKEVRPYESGLGGRVVSIWVGPGEHWYYAHLETVASGLAVGQSVTTGQLLGTVGNSGNARGTPPHLHIGNYVDGYARNPFPVLDLRCR